METKVIPSNQLPFGQYSIKNYLEIMNSWGSVSGKLDP